jgi:Tfp pilus assembly protein PilV
VRIGSSLIFDLRRVHAFSLVEVTLAMGVAAFCLLAVFGLMPIGVQTNRNATSQTRATNIMAAVIADLRATPKTAGTWTGTSSQFCITIPAIPTVTPITLYFDSEGRCSNDLAGTTGHCPGVTWDPALQTRYQVNITFSQQNPTPVLPALPTIYADLRVTWPAAVNPATTTPSGSAEMFAAFDRN